MPLQAGLTGLVTPTKRSANELDDFRDRDPRRHELHRCGAGASDDEWNPRMLDREQLDDALAQRGPERRIDDVDVERLLLGGLDRWVAVARPQHVDTEILQARSDESTTETVGFHEQGNRPRVPDQLEIWRHDAERSGARRAAKWRTSPIFVRRRWEGATAR